MARSRSRSTINIRLGQSYTLRKVVAGVNLATEDGVNQVIDILSMPPTRTGIHYSGNPNPSAAAGEAPSPQTGQLLQGMAREPVSIKGAVVSSKVANRTIYAERLQNGTENHGPWPFISRLRDEANRARRLLAVFHIGARRA